MSDHELRPDFLIGGAPRSGTTYLCHALARHPRIYVAQPYNPEAKVLVGPLRSPEQYRQRYQDLFAAAPDGVLLGEKTSYYLENEEACERIQTLLPNVRILFIVREPVDRAYSNYLWSRQNGLEMLSFEQAVELEGMRPSPFGPERSYARPFDYLSRGDYARFARRYYQALGRDRVAFFLYEDLRYRGDRLLRDIQEFLRVEPLPLAKLDPGVVNAIAEGNEPMADSTAAALRRRMRPAVLEFAEVTGLDIRVWNY